MGEVQISNKATQKERLLDVFLAEVRIRWLRTDKNLIPQEWYWMNYALE
jgi:hypothetical protein